MRNETRAERVKRRLAAGAYDDPQRIDALARLMVPVVCVSKDTGAKAQGPSADTGASFTETDG